MTALSAEDLALAREQGDLAALMLMAVGLAPAAPEQRLITVVAPDLPRARPGAWPTGIRPPGPLAPAPPGAWSAALDRYRAGTDNDGPCECAGCQLLSTTHKERP